MAEIDPVIQKLAGIPDYSPEELAARYAYERDIRLRPEKNDQYIRIDAEFGHYADDPYVERRERAPLFDTVDVAIIGGGFAGVLAGVKLRQRGFESIRMIEKGGDFGGTWYWNRYPGVRCDAESYVYLPMIEAVGDIPSEKYVRGSEILNHTLKLVKRFDLYRDACLQTAVTGLRWNEETRLWMVSTDRGDEMQARFVIMANGPLNKPKLPGIPGIDRFKGHTFHTSRWDYGYTGGDETGGLSRLADKRIGLVGTGATAVQVAPILGEWAKHFYLFQRTPAAVDVRANRPTDPQWAAALQPGWQALRVDNFNRTTCGLVQEVDLVDDGFTKIAKMFDVTAKWAEPLVGRALTPEEADYLTSTLDHKLMTEIRARIDTVVKDPATAESLKPWHRRLCKRPLFSDEYLPLFNRPNVTLVDTAGKGIERVTENSVVVSGKAYEVDCLIFATGFEVGTEFTRRAGYEVFGRGGLRLTEHWKDGMRTYQGMFTRGFPNCFFIGLGQNANSTTMSYMLHEQAEHAAHTIAQVLSKGAATVEPLAEAVDAYVKEVRTIAPAQKKFWNECTPSYLNAEGDEDNPHGFLANLHPKNTVEFYEMLANWREQGELAGLELK